MEARRLRGSRVHARGRGAAARAHHPVATLALARVEVDGGEFEARARLEPLQARAPLNVRQRQIATHLFADALHGLGRADQAFELYGRMKQTFARRHARRFGTGGAVESLRVHRAAGRMVRAATADVQRTTPASNRIARARTRLPAGYLRSGVTLVETILLRCPTCVYWRKGDAGGGRSAFLKDDASLAHLEPLDEALADQARTAYWTRVREAVPDVDGKVFVDMSPLYGIAADDRPAVPQARDRVLPARSARRRAELLPTEFRRQRAHVPAHQHRGDRPALRRRHAPHGAARRALGCRCTSSGTKAWSRISTSGRALAQFVGAGRTRRVSSSARPRRGNQHTERVTGAARAVRRVGAVAGVPCATRARAAGARTVGPEVRLPAGLNVSPRQRGGASGYVSSAAKRVRERREPGS